MTIDQHNSVYHVYSVLNSVNWSEMCGFADVLTVLQLSPTRSILGTGTIAKIRCQEVDISIIDRYNSFDNRYGFFVSNGNTSYKDKMVSRPAARDHLIIIIEIPIPGKTSFILKQGPCVYWQYIVFISALAGGTQGCVISWQVWFNLRHHLIPTSRITTSSIHRYCWHIATQNWGILISSQ